MVLTASVYLALKQTWGVSEPLSFLVLVFISSLYTATGAQTNHAADAVSTKFDWTSPHLAHLSARGRGYWQCIISFRYADKRLSHSAALLPIILATSELRLQQPSPPDQQASASDAPKQSTHQETLTLMFVTSTSRMDAVRTFLDSLSIPSRSCTIGMLAAFISSLVHAALAVACTYAYLL